MYIRLSREDGDKQESESVANQRDIITRYINENNLTLIDEYVDDGVSGTTFDRPNFNRMIADIQNRRIDMVITKDLSRLGRDYIQTGFYIENYFPENQVRYVSILDGIDTYSETVNNDITPFKAIMNDMYAKDISKKIRSVFKEKQKQGEYLCSTPAYGYKKDELNNHRLVVDENVADIVRKIFEMYVNGKGSKIIVKWLNNNHYLSPSGYRKTKVVKDENTSYKWNTTTICAIIKNEVYIGNTIQNKMSVISYKVKKVRKVDKSQHIVVEGTHEAIIDKDTFEKAQLIQEKQAKNCVKQYDYLLRGIMYCKHCGRKMQIVLKVHHGANRAKIPYIVDSDSKKRGCYARNINYPKFEKTILTAIKKVCQIYSNKTLLKETYQKHNNKAIDLLASVKKQIANVEGQITTINRKLDQLYDDKLSGLLQEMDFARISQRYINERNELVAKQSLLLEQVQHHQQQKLSSDTEETQRLNKAIDEFLKMENIDKPILYRLINKIEIDKDKNVFISFNFSQLNIINENIDDFVEIEKIYNTSSNVKQNVG